MSAHRPKRIHSVPEGWTLVPGWPGYAAREDGRIWSLRFNRELQPQLGSNGYFRLLCYFPGGRKTRPVHQIIAETFLGPRPDGWVVRHLDGNPKNNHIDNLQYGTFSDNANDAVRHGTHSKASKTHCSSGHEYNAENTVLDQGNRRCVTCKRASNQRVTERRRRERAERVAS